MSVAIALRQFQQSACVIAASFASVVSAAALDITSQQKLAQMAVPFVPNAGQWDARAAFAAKTFAGTLFVTQSGALVYTLPGKLRADATTGTRALAKQHPLQPTAPRSRGWVLSETLVDASGEPRAAQGRPFSPPVGAQLMPGKVSYGVGEPAQHADNLDTFERVNFGDVYPGINLQLRATGNNVEKIFTVAPMQNAALINIKLAGANALEIGAQGELIAHTGNGPVAFTAPIAFQHNARGERQPISVAYALNATHNTYRFALGHYDLTRPLIIDPLLQSTYMGGTGDENTTAMTIHPVTGDVYVAGYTTSTNLPGVLPGAAPGGGVATGAQSVYAGGTDAFVTRFNAALTARLQTTYVGGAAMDQATALAVHPVSGEVYVAGVTASAGFPGLVPGAGANGGGVANGAQTTYGGGSFDGFVTRFNASLTTRLQSTLFGGAGLDVPSALAIHPVTGDVYISGITDNVLPGVGGAQSTPGGVVGKFDGFIVRFNAALTSIGSATYFGGAQDDFATAIAIHPVSGEIVLAGYGASPTLPAISGGSQSAVVGGGLTHAFVARFNAGLTAPVLQSTFLGGSGNERVLGVAIHPVTGEIYIAGVTSSFDLPGVTGGTQSAHAGAVGSDDGYVARFNAALTRRQQVTFVGGSDVEQLNALAIHPATGDVYVAGTTASNDYPGTAGGAQSSKVAVGFAIFDAFVSRLSASLSGPVLQSTYMGGAAEDYATALAIHPTSGEVYITGQSTSSDLPGTSGGAQPGKSGAVATYDGFVVKYSLDLAAGLKVPAAFAFAPKLNVPVNSLQSSNGVQISGVTGNLPVSIVGGNFAQYCLSSSAGCSCDVQAFGNVAATMNNSQYVCVRQVAPPNTPALAKATLLVGGGWADFVVTTGNSLASCNLDVDGSGGAPNALTDGLILLRAMLGFTGTAVTNGAIIGTPPRNTWALIQPYLNANCGTNFLP